MIDSADPKQRLLAAWGWATTAAYLLTQAVAGLLGDADIPIMVLWAVAMAVPIAMTLRARGEGVGTLSAVWIGLVLLGMAENVGVELLGASEALEHFSFRTMWFLIGAVGFAYTAAVVTGSTRKAAYAAWAVANAVALGGLLVAYELFEGWAFVLAALIQGVPMLVDLPLRRAAHAPDLALAAT